MKMNIRETMMVRETINSEGGAKAPTPVTRVAGTGIIENPFAGTAVGNLSGLLQMGHDLGARLMSEMDELLSAPAVSYRKAAIVGVGGDLESGHAMLHPMLGKAMRDPLGGGKAIIPSAAKVAGAGATLDIPLGHKDDLWSFDHFDAMTVSVSDDPRPNEIMTAITIADGERPAPRVGKTRAAT